MADPILLIGAGGFVGRRLLGVFAARDEPVIALRRSGFDAQDAAVEIHIRTTFGWVAGVGLPEGLERTWRWFNTSPR